MQIKLSFEEAYTILSEHIKRSSGMGTVENTEFVVEDQVNAKLVERPVKEQFSYVYFNLKK